MKKLSIILLGTLLLAGCAGDPILGTVTPMKEGYKAEATVDNGDVGLAKQIALNTAEHECQKSKRGFYVINEKIDAKNDYDVDDDTSNMANTASNFLLGKSVLAQNRTVILTFDCK